MERDIQVEKNEPGDDDRQSPFGALELSADVMDRSRIMRVNIELNVLEIGRVVEHVEDQTKRENGTRRPGIKTRRSHTSW